MKFQVEQTAFSGPLGLLLELLQKRQLEIKDVALAKIADDYLSGLSDREIESDEMADFLVIASRLIYLKSRELMPYLKLDEEEAEVASLEDQLRLYQMFVDAAEKLEKRFLESTQLYRRPFVKIIPPRGEMIVPANVSLSSLQEFFRSLLKKLEPFFAIQEARIEKVKSVEERIVELKKAFTARAKMKFQDIIATAQNKPEIVVSFLALLELVNRQIVRATQNQEHEIIIEKI